MNRDYLQINDFLKPQILDSQKDFLVVYKPPKIHSAPIGNSGGDTLLDWCLRDFPEIAELPGRKKGEGGMLHRLDYETHGLMIFARTLPGMKHFMEQQNEGLIQKEYSALTMKKTETLPGFPVIKKGSKDPRQIIKSAFRPFGQGRKAVRPVIYSDIAGNKAGKNKELALDKGKPYVTEILETQSVSSTIDLIILKIYRGFRHQIRCHLAWIGQPILNDVLYGGLSYGNGFLGLRAYSLAFTDPSTGMEMYYSVSPVSLDGI